MTWATALSLPATSSTAACLEGIVKCFLSMYLTALRDSMIQPGSGDVRSSCLGGRRMPLDEFRIPLGPTSKSPFLTRFSASQGQQCIHIHC
ncbi:hypothetical protein AKJ16_DCAP19250 [Drosera capensis]